jgi:hypothetical protein
MTTATITAMNNLSSIIDEWLSDITEDKPAKILSIDDPIAAACASYRYGKETGIRWTALADAKIEEQDRAKSQALRKYYAGKITFQALAGRPLTEFRKKLYGILTNEYRVTEQDQGLLQRLPYFYEEDLGMEDIVANTVSADRRISTESATALLIPYKKIFQGRKRGEFVQFWWRNELNQGVVLSVKTDSQFFALIDGLFDQPREFIANFTLSDHHWYSKDHLYYKMNRPRIA